jgi:hypothetical protein
MNDQVVEELSREPNVDAILDSEDLEIRETPVPEWKTTLWLHQLGSDKCIELTDMLARPQFKDDGIFLTLIYCAHNEHGERVFTMDHLPRLKKKSFKVLNRLQNICLSLNSIGKAVREELKKD